MVVSAMEEGKKKKGKRRGQHTMAPERPFSTQVVTFEGDLAGECVRREGTPREGCMADDGRAGAQGLGWEHGWQAGGDAEPTRGGYCGGAGWGLWRWEVSGSQAWQRAQRDGNRWRF